MENDGLDLDADFDKDIEKLGKLLTKFIKEFAKEVPNMDTKTGIPLSYGFNMRIDEDGKPIIENLGSIKLSEEKLGLELSVEGEELLDVIENKNTINVIAEMHGVSKDGIRVHISNEDLVIDAKSPNGSYHKLINIPKNISFKNSKAIYNNGVLEVTLSKASKDIINKDIDIKVQ